MPKRKPKKVFRTPEQVKRERELAEQWEALKARHQFRSSTPKKGEPAERPHAPLGITQQLLPTKVFRRPNLNHIPSLQLAGPVSLGKSVAGPKYSGEMAEREAEAQKRIAEKRKQVAPISNKGGLQLITNPDDFKTMGRKV